MKRILKSLFILFLISISFLYLKDYLKNFKYDRDFRDVNNNRYIMSILNNTLYSENNLGINDIYYVDKDNDIKKEKNNYLFYIYNTHQTEEYEEGVEKPYDIKCNVVTASYMLEDLLSKMGYNVLVEERNVLDIVNKNGWSYNATYTVTEEFVKEIKERYPTIKYFIDIHRDGASISTTKASINNKSYAKIMFTIGKDRKNLDANLLRVDKLREYLDSNYSGILRNNFYREEEDFNQYLDDNMFLIEIGGQYNTLSEVYNSIVALSEAFNYVEESHEF